MGIKPFGVPIPPVQNETCSCHLSSWPRAGRSGQTPGATRLDKGDRVGTTAIHRRQAWSSKNKTRRTVTPCTADFQLTHLNDPALRSSRSAAALIPLREAKFRPRSTVYARVSLTRSQGAEKPSYKP